jgi:hypothetical protein
VLIAPSRTLRLAIVYEIEMIRRTIEIPIRTMLKNIPNGLSSASLQVSVLLMRLIPP